VLSEESVNKPDGGSSSKASAKRRRRSGNWGDPIRTLKDSAALGDYDVAQPRSGHDKKEVNGSKKLCSAPLTEKRILLFS